VLIVESRTRELRAPKCWDIKTHELKKKGCRLPRVAKEKHENLWKILNFKRKEKKHKFRWAWKQSSQLNWEMWNLVGAPQNPRPQAFARGKGGGVDLVNGTLLTHYHQSRSPNLGVIWVLWLNKSEWLFYQNVSSQPSSNLMSE
jgi:hypothetical protein